MPYIRELNSKLGLRNFYTEGVTISRQRIESLDVFKISSTTNNVRNVRKSIQFSNKLYATWTEMKIVAIIPDSSKGKVSKFITYMQISSLP